jgi:hypothetical protein
MGAIKDWLFEQYEAEKRAQRIEMLRQGWNMSTCSRCGEREPVGYLKLCVDCCDAFHVEMTRERIAEPLEGDC